MTHRTYVPNPKHKYPKFQGTMCPKPLTTEDAQALLDRAVFSPLSTKKSLWSVDGSWCFRALQTHPHGPDPSVWHGLPELGCEIPEAVLRGLEERGQITRAQRRRLRKQKRFPAAWPG